MHHNAIRKSAPTLTPKQMRRERGGAFGKETDIDTLVALASDTTNGRYLVEDRLYEDGLYARTHVHVDGLPPAPKVKPTWMVTTR